MKAENTKKHSVTRKVLSYRGDKLEEVNKDLVEEIQLRLYFNGADAGEMICSPWELKEAAVGYFYMKEYLDDPSDILEVKIDEEAKAAYLVAKEGGCVQKSHGHVHADDGSISVNEIMKLSHQLEEASGLFHRTGGVHCAAFVRDGKFLSYKEDVSRHVAVDKVVGDCLLQDISMQGGILVFSGRVPAEIMQKVAAMGCSVLIAKSAPTNYSCNLAEKLGITLIGFARDNGFNIYSHPERVYE